MIFPKVLIIGQPFNNSTGGGITLSNLFSGWDRDKLAVVSSGILLSGTIDTELCNTYYRLGNKEYKWMFPFNLLQRNYTSGLLEFDENKIQDLTIRRSKLRDKLILNIFLPILKYFGLFHIIYKTRLSEDFCRWLDNFDPAVIYIQATSRDAVLFCLSVHSYLKKPLVFHIMDDWPSTISDKGILKKYWNKRIDHELRLLLDKATILMSISDEMAAEYKKRYGRDFITFHNSINMKLWEPYQKKNYELESIPSILYTGRIGVANINSLVLMAKVINNLNSDRLRIKFDIFSPDYNSLDVKLFYNLRGVQLNKAVPYSSIPPLLASYDLLFLPLDFDRKGIKYAQLSMPTKVPEYMISGTPIIILAPDATALVNYAKKYNWAYVINKRDINEISLAVNQLIENSGLRNQIAQNAIEVAKENHDSTCVTKHFREIILSIT